MVGRSVRERIQEDLAVWFADGIIDQQTLDVLRERYESDRFGLTGIIKYIGITGGLFAFFGILGMIGALARSVAVGMILTGGVGAGLVAWGLRLGGDLRERYATSFKVVLTLGVVLCVGTVAMLAGLMGMKREGIILFTGAVSLPAGFFLAYRRRNGYLLVLSLLAFFHWFGAWNSMSGRSTYVLSLQDPMAMSVVGALVAAVGVYHERELYPGTGRFYLVWESLGLLYMNISLLILSILSIWSILAGFRQDPVLWISVFTVVTVGQIVLGAVLQNGLFRGFGITFFAINIFTRFHELFWSRLTVGAYLMLGGCLLFVLGMMTELIVRTVRNNGEPS